MMRLKERALGMPADVPDVIESADPVLAPLLFDDAEEVLDDWPLSLTSAGRR